MNDAIDHMLCLVCRDRVAGAADSEYVLQFVDAHEMSCKDNGRSRFAIEKADGRVESLHRFKKGQHAEVCFVPSWGYQRAKVVCAASESPYVIIRLGSERINAPGMFECVYFTMLRKVPRGTINAALNEAGAEP